MYGDNTITRGQLFDNASFKSGNLARVKLNEFCVYDGVVRHIDYVTRKVDVDIDGHEVKDCIYVTNTVAGMLGFSSTQLPPVGTSIICFYTGDVNWVISTQPAYTKNVFQYQGDATGVNEYSQASDKELAAKHEEDMVMSQGYATSRDVLPGEEEFANNLGMALRLLTNIAQLDAGGLAKIECHLYNDMVRIVDNYYAHHHAGGDTFIWSNGRNNYEEHFTQYPGEAMGGLVKGVYAEPFKPFAPQDVFTLPDGVSPISATGKWRKSSYLGFLGDMLHYWITEPVKVISNYAQGAARASRFKTWVGADGTLMVQAAGDIMINVTQHMVIPEIHFKWDDPAYDPDKVLQQLDIEYLKIWGKGKTYWEDIKVSCWQMRNYLKYITIWHSLERFRQMSKAGSTKYCSIKPETENPVGNPLSAEGDKIQANGEIPSGGGGSCLLHLSPDSSITLVSGDSTSCIMNNGNIQLSAPHNIEIKAGGTFSVTSRDISLKAARHIEIASLAGTIFMKARTALKALCEAGRIWIKGDAPNTISKKDEDSLGFPEDQEFNKYSIVIDSSRGETLVHGYRGVTVGATGPDSAIYVQNMGPRGSVNFRARGNMNSMSSMYNIRTNTLLYYTWITRWWGRYHNIMGTLQVQPGIVDLNSWTRVWNLASPNTLYARVFQSKETSQVFPTKPELREIRQATAYPIVYSDKDLWDHIYNKVKVATITTPYVKDEFKNGDEKWEFYDWQKEINKKEVLAPSSLKADPWMDTFMKCEVEEDRLKRYHDIHWDDAEELKLLYQLRTKRKSYPWPGKDAKFFLFEKTSPEKVPIGAPWNRDFKKEDIGSLSDMKPKDIHYFFLKKGQEDKLQK